MRFFACTLLVALAAFLIGCGQRGEDQLSQDQIDAARERVKAGEAAKPTGD